MEREDLPAVLRAAFLTAVIFLLCSFKDITASGEFPLRKFALDTGGTGKITISTSQGTFVLFPPAQCINSNCLNGTIVVAQQAGAALAADINTAATKAATLESDANSLGRQYQREKNNYGKAKKQYDDREFAYTRDVNVHNTAVIASNNKPAERRDAAEVARLNQNKATLDVRYQELDKELVPLQGMWQNLQQIKSGLDSKVREASLVHEKINVALEQLRRCEQYGKEAAKIAEERGWGTYHYEKDFFGTLKIVPSKNLLNGWAERMKSLASKQWD